MHRISGAQIKAARILLGLSQFDLAGRLNCHRNMVSRIENGEENEYLDRAIQELKRDGIRFSGGGVFPAKQRLSVRKNGKFDEVVGAEF